MISPWAASPTNRLRLEELSLEEVEYMLVKKTMKRFDGNVAKAAETLGLTRSSMYRQASSFRSVEHLAAR